MIELGTLLAGPFAGRLLGDMGAEVIKVEPPGKPDPLRDWGQARYEGRSLWWPVQSRNKKCITLNLREPKGQELLLELVRVADVVSENFRPGTLERWNLGYEQLSAVNPGIVLARISGYGQTGPYAERAGFASVAEAMGGLRYINGFPGEAPPRAGHLARRLARGDVRRAGDPRRALPPRRARRRPGPGRRRLADGGVVRAARERRARVRPARHRPRADGHEAQGHRAVEHLQVARRPVGRDRREPGQRLPPAVRGDGPPRARRRPALRDASRARREPGRDRGHRRRVGGAARRRARSTASSTRPVSSAGRSTRWPRSSRIRSSRRARCSSSTWIPSSGRTSGRGSSPSSRRRRARCGGRARGRRAATTRRSTAACSGSPTPSSAALREDGVV